MQTARVAAVFVLACLIVACGGPPDPAPSTTPASEPSAETTPAKKKIITRDEFRRLTEGKTKEEIKASLGPPDQTTEHRTTGTTWRYHGLTKDPDSGKADGIARISFKSPDGKAGKATFVGGY